MEGRNGNRKKERKGMAMQSNFGMHSNGNELHVIVDAVSISFCRFIRSMNKFIVRRQKMLRWKGDGGVKMKGA